MIKMQTSLDVADNSGARRVEMIMPIGGSTGKIASLGDRIKVTVALKLNRDGSLRARPVVEDAAGVDDENRRYVERVKDMAIATFVGCSPLHDLPGDLYDVPGGWSDFALRYKLP